MNTVAQETLQELLAKDTWTMDDARALTNQLASLRDPVGHFREALSDLEAANPSPKGTAALKIGIARFLLNRYAEALDVLAEATDNKDRRFVAGQCYLAVGKYDEAIEDLDRAKARGWEGPECDVLIIEAHALAGRSDEARQAATPLIKSLGEEHADAHYLRGLLAELHSEPEATIDAYNRAREIDPDHPRATFRLAYFLDLHGQEDLAIDLYMQCVEKPPVHTNALLNLAVLMEDDGDYDEAAGYLHRLLNACPNHPRARLFLRDVLASQNMYYDEDQARRIAKRNAVLDIPVTDFELSVRARNCLKKMNIMTLGDLVSTSEAELLGYKNFGETSLKEIKEMLAAKGLRLGQASEDEGEYAAVDPDDLFPQQDPQDAIRALPVEQIEFSVRARRVLEQLNVQTLGELANKSEAELMGQKNFGQTSLQELRQRLTDHGLSFRDAP